MKWREYPTETARRQDEAHTGGIERTGQKWSMGPSIGTIWAVPDDPPRRMALVHRAATGPAWSAADQDQLLKTRTP